MGRFNYFLKTSLKVLAIIFLFLTTGFSSVYAEDKPIEEISITVNNIVCPERYTVDLSQNTVIQFGVRIYPNNITAQTINWNLTIPSEDPDSIATIDEKGEVTFNSTTDPDYPLVLSVAINGYESDPVFISVVNGKDSSSNLESLVPKYETLYISNKDESINLFDNLIPTPANVKINLKDFIIGVSQINPKIEDGILYLDENSNDEIVVKVQSLINPSISAVYKIVISKPSKLTKITTVEEMELTTLSEPENVDVKFIPSNTTQALNIVLTYESSNPDVAIVDEVGNVTPVSIGEAVITATATFEDGTKTKVLTSTTTVKVTDGIAVEGISLDTNLIELSTLVGAKNTYQLKVNFSPTNTTQRGLNYTSLAPSVAEVNEAGLITAVSQGKTTIIITDEVGHQVLIVVNVSNSQIVSDYTTIVAPDPDEFTIIVKNAHYNSALTESKSTDLQSISCFAFSDKDNMSDVNAKLMTQQAGTKDWQVTIPVNGNGVNNYFKDANDIQIHVYATDKTGKVNSLISYLSYNYVNHGTSPSNLTITPYAQNLGFITPSFGQDTVAGTVGQNRQLEGIRISTPINGLGLEYSVHVANLGWLDPVSSGTFTGTMNKGLRLEAIKIKLTGQLKDDYKVQYRVHMQNTGWGDWVSDGEIAGTTGEARQIEALQARIIKK